MGDGTEIRRRRHRELRWQLGQTLLSVQYDIAAAHADRQECLSYQGGQYYTYENSLAEKNRTLNQNREESAIVAS